MPGTAAEMKKEWKAFKRDEPGERFQNHRDRMERRPRKVRVAAFGAGALLLAGGIAFCVLPGPGLPLVLFGLALVAAESPRLARLLDRGEPKARAAGRHAAWRWKSASVGAKVMMVAGGACLVAAAIVFAWHFVVSKYV